MKRNAKDVIGYTMGATDGEIGKVKEFYFDDQTWTVRYLIVETGNWLSGRKVLISPQALLQPDWQAKTFPVNLTQEQVRNSPDIGTDKPVSRQEEIKLYTHYSWNRYWGAGTGAPGMVMPVYGILERPAQQEEMAYDEQAEGDPHLRSTQKVKGYEIQATDGEVGEVKDFIIDDETWRVDFLVIDTGNWFSGKEVLLSPECVEAIQWDTSKIVVNISLDHIKNSPEYDSEQPINEAYIRNLSDYYENVFK